MVLKVFGSEDTAHLSTRIHTFRFSIQFLCSCPSPGKPNLVQESLYPSLWLLQSSRDYETAVQTTPRTLSSQTTLMHRWHLLITLLPCLGNTQTLPSFTHSEQFCFGLRTIHAALCHSFRPCRQSGTGVDTKDTQSNEISCVQTFPDLAQGPEFYGVSKTDTNELKTF